MMDTTCSNSASNSESVNPQTILATHDKVFQTGQIWSFCSGEFVNYDVDLPLHYGKIQKITSTHEHEAVVTKLHVSRLIPSRSPDDVIQHEDKKMPVGCGTFYASKVVEIIAPDDVSQQILPQISADGNEYTILPKIGEVWVIYASWNHQMESYNVGLYNYDIVEILDDALNYEVLLLENSELFEEFDDERKLFQAVTENNYNEVSESEQIFTIPKSERLRFSHKARAWRVTEEISEEMKEFIKVGAEALPINLRYPYC